MELSLTQYEADTLFALEKHHRETESYTFPSLGGRINIPLYFEDSSEKFHMDITRSRIELKKYTFQNRVRKTIALVRIDIHGPPHRNPDGEEIPCPHMHKYREKWGDKWAEPLPNIFSEISDTWQTLEHFMQFCNIKTKPEIIGDLFT